MSETQKAAIWFNGVLTVINFSCFVGLLKSLWDHSEAGIGGAVAGLLIFGSIWVGTFFEAQA